MGPAPRHPPPPSPERGGDVIATEERLANVRLYRVPISVTVAARSQKQIAFLKKPAVKIDSVLRLRLGGGSFDMPLEQVLVTRTVALKASAWRCRPANWPCSACARAAALLRRGPHRRSYGRREVEIKVATATGFGPSNNVLERTRGRLRADPDQRLPRSQTVEIELPLDTKARGGTRLVKRDGWMLWRVTVPANGSARLRYI